MRVAELLPDSGASIPQGGLHLYVSDTLDDPYADLTHIASELQTIAKSRKRANELKRSRKVNVVIGNPPYRELASGAGAWVERGHAAERARRPFSPGFWRESRASSPPS